jgi:predicted amidophosphoribosyltransferase
MEITRHWRLKDQRYRLQGFVCQNCGQPLFPPRPVCPHCVDQLARITTLVIPVLRTSISASPIETRSRYESTERMIR